MTLYGYARVSVREPEDKNLDLQVERLVRWPSSLRLARPHVHGTSCGLQDTQVRIDFLPVLVAALRSCSPELNGPCYRLLTSRFCVTLTDVKVRLNRFLRYPSPPAGDRLGNGGKHRRSICQLGTEPKSGWTRTDWLRLRA